MPLTSYLVAVGVLFVHCVTLSYHTVKLVVIDDDEKSKNFRVAQRIGVSSCRRVATCAWFNLPVLHGFSYDSDYLIHFKLFRASPALRCLTEAGGQMPAWGCDAHTCPSSQPTTAWLPAGSRADSRHNHGCGSRWAPTVLLRKT